MHPILKSISYIFHPLFVPFGGTVAYFLITPKYSSLELQSGNILPIFILTIIIPIISFFILKNLGLLQSIFATSLQERKYPLFISIFIYLMILFKVIPKNYVIELYFFFVGLLVASLTMLIMLFLKVKASIHLLGMGSILMFLIGLSIHFEINITIAIGLFTLFSGMVASSRLYLKAHSKIELLIGFLIGFSAQLFTLKYWL